MTSERFDLSSVVEASELLNASLDLDFVLGNLLLVAMSRLLAPRGVVLLADPADPAAFRVAAVKGSAHLEAGSRLTLLAPADVAVDDAVGPALRERGFALLLPIRQQGRTIGLVALGPKATGEAYAPAEVAFARSLVGISAAAIHNAGIAAQLQQVNLDLSARVQELNTLFELSQAFGMVLDREQALRVLSLTLMGQFLVERHAMLLRAAGSDAPLEAVLTRGLSEVTAEALSHLALLDAPCRPDTPDEAQEQACEVLRHYGLALALPLRMQDTVRGLLLLGPRATGRPYEDPDLAFLTSLGTLALSAVENADLVASRIEKERLEEELRLARTIQKRLLPDALPDVPGYDLAALSLASRHVAGDYFDLLSLDEERLLVAIADVSGKGAPAALLMANLQAGLHLLRHRLDPAQPDLARATASLNRVVCENTDPASFITLCWGVLNAPSGRFRYVNAGHNPPRLVRADGTVETLDCGGLLLGVLTDAAYEEGEVVFAPGDVLAAYTDGLTEARNAADEEYGEERLDAALMRHRTEAAANCLQALRADAEVFADGLPFADDLTLLVLRASELNAPG